jgi:ribonuclease R
LRRRRTPRQPGKAANTSRTPRASSQEERASPKRSSRSDAAPIGAARSARKPGKSLSEVEGILSANRNGYGFVRTDALTESVFLPPQAMQGLMHGDRVRIAVRSDAQGRHVGRPLAVIERGVQAFLGTVEAVAHGLHVRSADGRLGLLCRVVDNPVQARAGDWVIARVLRYPEPHQVAEARIEQKLDPERPVHLATEAAIARFGLPVEFSAAALREAANWGKTIEAAEAAQRVDLRPLPLVTIDGEHARDFDDAVYAEPAGDGGFRLLVAIADVSHYVRPGSALDTEARSRGTSVYFPTRVLPMLPTALSNHLCSLEPNVDRLCMVADMQVTKRGVLQASRFYPAVMRSAARLTYREAHAALFTEEPAARARLGGLLERIKPLVDVYRALVSARHRRGALDFDAPEAEFVFEGEQVRAIAFVSRNDAHRLIEECMILANVAVARELSAQHIPALFRVHAPPDERKLELLSATLRILGLEPKLPHPVQPRDLAAIGAKLRDPESRPFIESQIVRSMAQAMYQPDNIGHFGLALPDYAHFTSPIRRYPDLMIHRALRAREGALPLTSLPTAAELVGQGADLSRLERRSDEADRYVATFLKCVYLRDRIGQTFDGLITTVTEFGCFVQLLALGIDGLLALTALRDDDYQMARDGGQWIGRRSSRRLAPGGRLRVVVAAVKPVEGLIDLELASD